MGWPLEGFCLGPDLTTLRGQLTHEPFAAGRTLTVDKALDEALADAAHSEPLAAREGEIAVRPGVQMPR